MTPAPKYSPKSFFFMDPAEITQSADQAFGPVSENQFRLTTKFSVRSETNTYLWWGSENPTIAGSEDVMIGIKQFVTAHPSLPDVVEVGLYAVWYGTPVSGDFTVALVTWKGGAMSQSGTDFINTGGTQVSSHTINANTQIHNQSHTPANAYKVGTLKYTRSTLSAVIVIN